MKFAIIGSRTFENYGLLKEIISPYLSHISLIISGGAQGADKLGERYADENNIPKQIFLADWDNLNVEPLKIKYNKFGQPYNALAGFVRNKLIVDNSDVVIAFWDGKSPGTKDSLDYAKKLNKQIRIIKF